jgi:hypothetical protein
MGKTCYWPNISDPHDPVLSVVAFGQRHNIEQAALRVSHDPGHVPNLKFDSHHIPILPKEKGINARAAGPINLTIGVARVRAGG